MQLLAKPDPEFMQYGYTYGPAALPPMPRFGLIWVINFQTETGFRHFDRLFPSNLTFKTQSLEFGFW
jgi:hypothetical protein